MSKRFVQVTEVQEGDVLCYADGEIQIERVSVARCDGWIGLHGNNDTWSTWFAPSRRVRIKAQAEAGAAA